MNVGQAYNYQIGSAMLNELEKGAIQQCYNGHGG